MNATVTGVLYGYLPFEGLVEVMTPEGIVRLFSVAGEAQAVMRETPDGYAHLIHQRVVADVQQRHVVGLRLAPRP